MRVLAAFIRLYPRQSVLMLIALFLAGFAEGGSIAAALPLLSLVAGQQGEGEQQHDDFSRQVAEVFSTLGVEPTLGVLLVVIVIGLMLKNVLLLFATKQIGYTAAQVTTGLRLDLLRAMLATRWSYFLHQPVGKMANAMTSEAVRASNAYVGGTTLLATIIQALVYTAVAVMVSWRATLAALGVGVFVVIVFRSLVKMARKAGRRQTELSKSLITRLTDTLQSVKPLKAMGREHLADAVLAAETGKINQSLERQVFGKAVLEAAQEPMFAVVIAIGVYAALEFWGMPFPTVLVLVLLLTRILKHIGNVQKQYQKMVISESAFWSLHETIEQARTEEEDLSGVLKPSFQSEVQFDRVSFRYDHQTVLKDVDLHIPAGQVTTLIGGSGAGKTTIIDLITGLHKPKAGKVLVDGNSIEDLDLKRWRRMIGYVPQENILLHDSVLNNVTLGDPDLTESDATEALQFAGAWDFVSANPEGLHAVVGERGTKLSGGQRQRIMIARALVHRPQLLILDEATSALDPKTEQAICETLISLRGRLTILAISHQTALVGMSDRVYRLADGKAVLEKG